MAVRRAPAWAWVLGAWILLVAAGAAVQAASGVPLETCLFRRITGHPCPTCGSTRSVLAFLRGDWSGSLRSSPLLWIAAVAGIGTALLRWRLGPEAWRRLERHRNQLLLLGLALLLANWAWGWRTL